MEFFCSATSNGMGFERLRTSASSMSTSISPVGFLGSVVPSTLSRTVPVTATTYSRPMLLRTPSNRSKSPLVVASGSNTAWVLPWESAIS